jgi:prepilin-type N-terminal cleavage/methylation domain-containing protein
MCTERVNKRVNKRVHRSAFTLLEVTLAVAIMGMMAMAIYRFVQTNLIALRASTDAAVADARYDGLRELLLSEWEGLAPGQGALTGEPAKLNERSRDEIRWICGAGPGLLTRYAPGDYVVFLRMQRSRKKSGQYDLGLLRRPKGETEIVHENDTWVPLIEDVGSLEIRYYDPRLNIWVDRWSDTLILPRLIKVTIGRFDAPAPWEIIVPLGRTPY